MEEEKYSLEIKLYGDNYICKFWKKHIFAFKSQESLMEAMKISELLEQNERHHQERLQIEKERLHLEKQRFQYICNDC
jgi:rubrerythrin